MGMATKALIFVLGCEMAPVLDTGSARDLILLTTLYLVPCVIHWKFPSLI